MCDVCGLFQCIAACPNYDPRKDPSVTGYCRECGAPLYVDGSVLCVYCEKEYGTMHEIEFNSEKHEYTVDGEWVPCVSDIVSVYGKDVEEGDDLELRMDAAAERGTICHYILASYLQGDRDVEYPSEYEPYVESINLFLSEHKLEPLAIETPVYSEKYGYAGTPDFLGHFDDVLTVLDWKFVRQLAKTKVKAQVNAYGAAYEEQNVWPDQLAAVQFLDDGTYRVYPVAYGVDELEAAVQVWKYKHQRHKRGEIS